MKYIKEFSNWNPDTNKKVLDFIDTNKVYLMSNFFDDEKSDDENMKDLIDYYTKYPEEMKNEIDIENVKSVLPNKNINNMTPTLMNVGGVIKR